MDPTADIWGHCLEHAVVSDVGLRRANNQDSCAISLAGSQEDFQQRGHFFMVADGMGAHAAGELASKMAVDAVAMIYRKRLDQSPPEALLSSLLDANRQIHNRGQASPDFRGMGTTATALVLLPAGAMVAHVGDSRAYQIRGSSIEQLTFDHSLVWELRAAGQPNVELPSYISKNIITRSLGPNSTVQVDLEGPYPAQPGDAFLLCSDGLSGQIKDEEIGMIVGCLPTAEAAQSLIDLANLRGGPDNITVVLARVLGPQVTQVRGADATTMARWSAFRPIRPWTWLVMGVAGLAAVGLLALGHPLVAMAAFSVALVAAVAAMIQRYGGTDGRQEAEMRRFGRGPYVTSHCEPNEPSVTQLADMARQLREVAAKRNIDLDGSAFERFEAESASCESNGDWTGAARGHLRALSALVAQVRSLQNAADKDDSSTDGSNWAP
ncbi:MAG: PP2C family serine/threonine-protein phosphatase [Thermoguttaceae bacterium]